MARNEHLDRALLLRVFQNEGTRREQRQVTRHLLRQCEACKALAAQVINEFAAGGEIDADAFQVRSVGRRIHQLAAERRAAPRLWEELRRLEVPQRELRVRNSPKFLTWGFVGYLLDYARRTTRQDPQTGLGVAELAYTVATLLHEPLYSATLLADTEVEALVEVANAHRILEQFHPAATKMREAEVRYLDGSQDPCMAARLDSVAASLMEDLGSFEDAVKRVRRAARAYKSLGDNHLYGRTKIKESTVLRHFDPVAGLRAAEVGLEHCDPMDNFAFAVGIHSRIDNMCEAGKLDEAALAFKEASALYLEDETSDTPTRVRLAFVWLAARIDKGIYFRDRTPQYALCAECSFESVFEAYIVEQRYQEMALVGLDLVELLLAMYRYDDAVATANASMVVFQQIHLHVDAMRAYRDLAKAIQLREAETAAVVEKARWNFSRFWSVGFGQQ